MIITCPSCDAQYLLPDESIGSNGRRVKCTTCSYTWLQRPEEEEFDNAPVLEDSYAAPAQSTHITPRHVITPVMPEKSMAKPILYGLGLGALLLVLTIGYGVMIRSSIVAGWPPAAKLFEAIGVAVPAPGVGLAIDDIEIVTTPSDPTGSLTVRGKMKNTTEKDIFLPILQVRLSGPNGWLKDWQVDLYGKTMPAKKEAKFEYTFTDAPAGGETATIRFID